MRIPDLETILEAAEWASADLLQRHVACDRNTDGDLDCAALMDAEGVPSEHALYRRFNTALLELDPDVRKLLRCFTGDPG